LILVAMMAIVPSTSLAASPPDSHDPCAVSGRDSCGTTGVGTYDTYQFGLRWFGDYRGAVPSVSGATFCIDLRFWFPGRAYRYQKRSANGLRNRAGGLVPGYNLHRMAYALWRYGRSNSARQQAATMLFVHGLMGDAAPGEVAPGVIGAGVNAVYDQIASDATRYAGPYSLQATLPSHVTAGTRAYLTVAVRAASGADVPGVSFDVRTTGAYGAPRHASSGGSGVARISLNADDLAGLHASVTTSALPSNVPVVYIPTRGAAAASGQRLVAPASQTLSARASAVVAPAQLTLATTASPAGTLALGSSTSDKVTIAGAPAGYRPTVQVALYGPFASQSAITCTGTPALTASYVAAGNGAATTPALTPTAPGYYSYVETIPGTPDVTGATTPCGAAAESFEVVAGPTVHTQVSASSLQPGGSLYDTVDVSGLGGQQATVTANLYGPFSDPTKLACTGAPNWTGTIQASGDGSYKTSPVQLTVGGYYVYQESIAASGFVQAATTSCSDAAESTVVQGAPTVTTQISAATAAPGSQIYDNAIVGGLGALSATVNVSLWGPYPSLSAVNCTGTPAWTGSVTANGNGTYQTAKVAIPSAGYYVYQESIASTPAYGAVTTPCADTAETVFAQGTPALGTQASSSVVRPGSTITDAITVSGLGKTPATIDVDLYGPYDSVAAISCAGRPAWSGHVAATGDGTVQSPAATIRKAGFYVFRERIVGSALIAPVQTPCAQVPETVLGEPMIITGGAFPVIRAVAAAAGGAAPARVQISSLGVDAPVSAVAIDLGSGDVAVPPDIHRAGWWKDGAAPADSSGTVLIAGHVDSAVAGGGAFFPLKSAQRSALIVVGTASGATYRYRVTRVQTIPKPQLPTGIFTRTGPRRLVLVTCGGPFDQRTKHYVDNVIVYATPA
jgi:hypothetical protein